MTMEMQELNDIVADFVQVGCMEAMEAYEPARDLVRASEVKAWLRMMRIGQK